MNRRNLLAATALFAAGCVSLDLSRPSPRDDRLDAQRAFVRMKSLAGSYEATTPGIEGSSKVLYEVTSSGHAILEKLNEGGDHEMTSVYYLEGIDLAMVHYCAIGNRPHMRLDRANSTLDDLRFEFDANATDVDPAKDEHIHSARFVFKPDGSAESIWTFWKDGREDHAKTFALTRSAVTPPTGPTAPADSTAPADPSAPPPTNPPSPAPLPFPSGK